MTPSKIPTKIKNKFKRILNVRDSKTPDIHSCFEMSDKEFLNKFNISKVISQVRNNNIEQAKKELVHYYDHRDTPKWRKPPNYLTDLRIDVGKLTEADVVQKADDVLAFKISPDGNLPRLDSNSNIDWNFNPVSSAEWLWRLNRHQWWALLATAYHFTKDEKYALAFVQQLIDWIKKNPMPPQKDEKSPTWRLMETAMRMVVSWIPCFHMFSNSVHFKPDDKIMMLRCIYDHGQFLHHFYTNRNHLLRESNGLAHISIYFPEIVESSEWLKRAVKRIKPELKSQINEDGSQIEVSPGYQWLVIDELEKIFDLFSRNNIDLFKNDLNNILKKMYHVISRISRPDGSFPEINDGFIRWPIKRVADAGKKLNREDLLYIGSKGSIGVEPEDRSVNFSDAGWTIMRSGWSIDSLYLLFDSGPYGGPHGHEDKLSVEAYAYGAPFIVDSGSYTYDRNDPFRNYFVSSLSHNTLTVNGKSQNRRCNYANMIPVAKKGCYTTWHTCKDYDYAESEYDEGYSDFNIIKPQASHMIADVIHNRRIIFVKPYYWLVIDSISSKKKYDYQILYHTHPDIVIREKNENGVLLESKRNNAIMNVLTCPGTIDKITTVFGHERPVQGWYSIDHHIKTPTTAIILNKYNSGTNVITTLLYPFRNKQESKKIIFERKEDHNLKSLIFKIETNESVEEIYFTKKSLSRKFKPHRKPPYFTLSKNLRV